MDEYKNDQNCNDECKNALNSFENSVLPFLFEDFTKGAANFTNFENS